MKKFAKKIFERDRKRNLGEELLQAVREIKAGKTGRVFQVEITQATEARLKLELSQAEFAEMLSVSVRTLKAYDGYTHVYPYASLDK